MLELKSISQESIPRALEKVERYRLLNEPWQAESICLDILQIEPENQQALVMLLLALTDQFGLGSAGLFKRAQEVIPRLHSEYERAYYRGIICERRAEAQLSHGATGSGVIAHHWLREAMGLYEKAGAIRPQGNDDAVLRWNTCARMIMRNPYPVPAEERAEVFVTME
ncbi:MAG TPA: hypothetical protein VLH58_00365 [Candidatus Methylomirabilis sp.]|nr:hypothetical protein [Candidatus Methylomirabilis sp.]HSC69772.1 hypothetical protein [Candidatus Methylomirabilis sp.]